MNRNLVAKGVAVLILGILFASYINHDYEKWRRLGRDAFIAHELERFDRFIVPVRPFGVMAVGAIVVTFIVLCLYEAIAGITSSLLRSMIPDQEKRPGATDVPFS